VKRGWNAVVLAGVVLGLTAVEGRAAADRPERPGWLGVYMDDALTGVRVTHVVRGSPAARAGLEDGDRITTVDSVDVREAAQVIRAVTSHPASSVVPIVVVREGRRLTLRAELKENPGSEAVVRMEHVGVAAPPFDGAIPIGAAPRSLASLRGRVVLVDFWATWCGPCRMIAPRLSALQDKLGAQGLRVVGMTSDSAEKAATYMDISGLRYPSLSDPGSMVSRAYHVNGIPALYVIDRRGVVREVFVGFDPQRDAKLEALVLALLAEPGPAPTAEPAQPAAPVQPAVPAPPAEPARPAAPVQPAVPAPPAEPARPAAPAPRAPSAPSGSSVPSAPPHKVP